MKTGEYLSAKKKPASGKLMATKEKKQVTESVSSGPKYGSVEDLKGKLGGEAKPKPKTFSKSSSAAVASVAKASAAAKTGSGLSPKLPGKLPTGETFSKIYTTLPYAKPFSKKPKKKN